MSQAACPKCGKILRDLWEYGEGEHEIACGWCDAPLLLKCIVSIDYELVEREGTGEANQSLGRAQ